MIQLGEQNITPGIILEALVDQVCKKKDEDLQKEQEPSKYTGVTAETISALFSSVQAKIEKPAFDQIEFKPIEIDEEAGDSTHFSLMINETDRIEKSALDKTFFNLDALSKRDRKVFSKILVPGIERHLMPATAPVSTNERDAESTYRHSFINCEFPEFKRRL